MPTSSASQLRVASAAEPAGIVTRRRSFTVIFNDTLPAGRISARAWGIYVYLHSRPDGWVTRVTHLQNIFTEGRDAIYTALGQLCDAGLMERETYSDRGLTRTRFAMVADPAPTSPPPDTDFQDPDFPAPEKPDLLVNNERATTDVVKDPLTSSLRSEVTPPPADDASSDDNRRDGGEHDALFEVHDFTAPRTKRGKAPTALPQDWAPSPAELAWAQAKVSSVVDVEFETRKFANHFAGKRKADWARTWRNWMLNAEKFAKERGTGTGRRFYSDEEAWGPREQREAQAAAVRESWKDFEAEMGRSYSPAERERMHQKLGRVIPDE